MTPENKKTFKVAVTLCLVCSVVVSSLAVGLKGIQEQNKEAFRQQSILTAAGLWEDGANPGELYKAKVAEVGIDLEDFKPEEGDLTADKFDMAKSLRSPELSRELAQVDDVAGLKKMEKYSVIYQIKDSDDKISTIVLPIRGRGLWSTLYGFIALDVKDIAKGPEHVTVAGLTYYKHGETPGLGGEVDNKLWKAKWPGKLVFDEEWAVKAEVTKSPTTDYQVDGLSGATLTSNGVSNMLQFWLGENGFGPYLQNLTASAETKEPQTALLSESPLK